MVAKANAAYIGGSGSVSFGSDEYTAAVTSFTLTPTTPKFTTRDIGGKVTSIVGQPTWVANVGYNQDWKTTDSLSQQLIAWHGTVKSVIYEPADGSKSVTIDVLIEAGAIGGGGEGLHAANVTLNCNGQPSFGA